MNFSTIARLSLKILTLTGSILLLLSCAYATVGNTAISFFDLLALVLPYLVIVNFLLGFLASLYRSKFLVFPFFALIVWFFVLGPFVVFNIGEHETSDNTISVMSYNIHGLEGNYLSPYADLDSRIIDFVMGQDADILCFQEFGTTKVAREKLKVYPYEFRYYFKGMNRYSPMAI